MGPEPKVIGVETCLGLLGRDLNPETGVAMWKYHSSCPVGSKPEGQVWEAGPEAVGSSLSKKVSGLHWGEVWGQRSQRREWNLEPRGRAN